MHRTSKGGAADRFLYALITIILAICTCCGLGGCKKEPAKLAKWAMICIKNAAPYNGQPNTLRASDESCSNKLANFHWLYVQQTDTDYKGCPPVAKQLPPEILDGRVTTSLEPPAPQSQIGFVSFNGGKAPAPGR